jgi:hypothetical protein
MRNNFLLLGFLAILSISCINTEKKNNTDDGSKDSAIVQSNPNETFLITDLHGANSEDSIEVLLNLPNRELLFIYSQKGIDIDSSQILGANWINGYEWFENNYFGLDVQLRCGSGCKLHEYHLYMIRDSQIFEVLVFVSYYKNSEVSKYEKRDGKYYYEYDITEYVTEFVYISDIDNAVTIFEEQRENFHDYSKVPDNFSQLYSLKWDSLNHVFCNTYMDICGEYHCQFRDDSSTEKDIVFQEKNIPAFKNTRYTYVYINNIWAILLSSNELLFTQML